MFYLINLTPRERNELAEIVGADPVYLWQCAVGIRSPSASLCKKLIKADDRLTLDSLLEPKVKRDKFKEAARLAAAQKYGNSINPI